MHLLIFDLDGTLIDSKLDLANAVNATRVHMGRSVIDNDTVYTWVGNGAPVLIKHAMGPEATEEELSEAMEFFLEYYRDHMLDFTRPYPGVKEALESFHKCKIPMAVLTNKPVRFSRDLVKGLGLGEYFFQVYGGNSFEHKKPHPMGVDALILEAKAARESTWMIGDSSVDIKTARNAGIKACGVTYGFQPESLVENPPDLLLDTLADLPEKLGF